MQRSFVKNKVFKESLKSCNCFFYRKVGLQFKGWNFFKKNINKPNIYLLQTNILFYIQIFKNCNPKSWEEKLYFVSRVKKYYIHIDTIGYQKKILQQ